MSRLIDADALKDLILKLKRHLRVDESEHVMTIDFDTTLDLITNATTVQWEGWVSLTDMQITNIAMQHQSLHQVAKAIDNELRAINNV